MPSRPHPAFDVYAQNCPTRMVLNRIGDKWALLILDCLRDGSARFSVIRRKIGGISQKVLSQVLKNLERDGLVLRTVHATVPVAVEYSLTSLGETLTQAVASLTHWAEQHMEEVQEAQLRYDGKRIDG
ncbi:MULTISPECIES: winged helix-turn-helix transcriptional regulator [Komagataeibacter]|uniref:Helix-turn-helix transcriptional regulator n=2 Tax=Komagataeibacter TaxID=1434011 RepID=A0ABS5SRY1_9PROT|nr:MULTISPECIES: helix-turn-helix domain-containing protein [Komagataeibacter]MBE7729839.1 helix-turn-helix transcriptional regulator [Komagataeibacter sp. FXV3]MBT0676903.1 helix-turn-helix transcriptional regulator [Komagataeibacter oboediens]MBT0680233.1 helix-turn-helix transcriptional regulator [Komagataeibacter oboediens]GCE80470.1 HxlR family transcriptional regulator [Komagataeibacter oboediens]GCE91925.1 HxlR family transcriptional regulator [Komagataeibacter diospyri]